MTDKEKFLKLFNELNIDYKEYRLMIEIGETSLSSYCDGRFRYGESVDIEFDENGKFKSFEGWGE